MKLANYQVLFLCAITLFQAQAQHFTEPQGYVDFINGHHKEVAQELVFYVNKLAHGKSAKQEEPVRKAILHKLKSASVRIGGMPDYKSDRSLQDSLVAYTRATYSILNTEYPKVLGHQDTASRSYEAAKGLAIAEAEALDLLIKDEDKFLDAINAFSTKYGVPVSDKHDDEYEEFYTIRTVSKYHNTIYLAYLKCQAEDALIAKAVEKKDKETLERHTALLASYVKEGQTTIDTAKAYKDDKALAAGAKQAFDFYQKELEFKLPLLQSYLSKNQTFDQTKKDFAAKANKTAEEIDQFNKETAEYNELASKYPVISKELADERPTVAANWHKASQSYLKKYLPSL